MSQVRARKTSSRFAPGRLARPRNSSSVPTPRILPSAVRGFGQGVEARGQHRAETDHRNDLGCLSRRAPVDAGKESQRLLGRLISVRANTIRQVENHLTPPSQWQELIAEMNLT